MRLVLLKAMSFIKGLVNITNNEYQSTILGYSRKKGIGMPARPWARLVSHPPSRWGQQQLWEAKVQGLCRLCDTRGSVPSPSPLGLNKPHVAFMVSITEFNNFIDN